MRSRKHEIEEEWGVYGRMEGVGCGDGGGDGDGGCG